MSLELILFEIILYAEVNFKMYNLNTGSFANTFDIFEPILK